MIYSDLKHALSEYHILMRKHTFKTEYSAETIELFESTNIDNKFLLAQEIMGVLHGILYYDAVNLALTIIYINDKRASNKTACNSPRYVNNRWYCGVCGSIHGVSNTQARNCCKWEN